MTETTAAQTSQTNESNDSNVSRYIPLEGVYNCRTLGGMKTMDGKVIKEDKLFRSSSLNKATLKDLDYLQAHGLKTDLDLRMEEEILTHPDQVLKNWIIDHQPVFHASTIMMLMGNPISTLSEFVDDTKDYLCRVYVDMLLNDRAIETWKHMFSHLLETDQATLFHCSEGKDRTGIAAMLIEAALGVDEESIRADYLETNRFVQKIIEGVEEKMADVPIEGRQFEEDTPFYYGALPSYFNTARNVVNHYGGWIGYLKEKIGLNDEQIDQLKEKYLEAA